MLKGGVKIYSQGFVPWALDGGGWSASRRWIYLLWDRTPGIHCINGCVGPSQSELCVEREISAPVRNGSSSLVPIPTQLPYVENEAHRTVLIKIYIFWEPTPCSPLKVNVSLGKTCRLQFQDKKISQIRNCFMLASCLIYSSTL
jgi:hypothetical protein